MPILYSFRRCPYAMRARMALRYSSIQVDVHEVSLKNKPQAMLQISPKGTVPILALPNGVVIDESLNIMRWALAQHDPEDWLMLGAPILGQEAEDLIAENDGAFKQALDRYKYATRFPEHPAEFYRAEGETFLQALELRLSKTRYLCREQCSFADIAIFPFIRQFTSVDEAWFRRAPYSALENWLKQLLDSRLFISIMEKHPAP
ncbi:MAG: glutathione S-transferase [Methylophilaceae bacterium]